MKELKNNYTTRVNTQVTTAQENLDIAKSSIAEIRQKVMSPYETRIDLSLLAFFTRGWTEKGGGGG